MKLHFDASVWVEHLRHGALDAIFPSLRSLTVAGVNRVAGNPWPTSGRNAVNHGRNSPSGSAARMHSASISAGERNSSPPGSQAWQSASAAYHRRTVLVSSARNA